MEPTSSASNMTLFSHDQPHDHEQQIITKAQAEAIKRLRYKFPCHAIEDYQVQLVKIELLHYADGSMGVDSDGFESEGLSADEIVTQGFESGYCVSFNYNNEIFHLHTNEGNIFISKDLNIDAYPEKIINLVTIKLSEKIKKDISVRKKYIEFNSIKKARGTQLPFSKCNNDLYRYMSQEREDVFIIQLVFDGSRYNFCINEEGKEMYAEI
ncbi:MAG: hypothetical protein H0W50_00085 [Parachlamydiaceae bacterium]|nr:hypothetical protein [Parachlamydiaceae bacterium]